MNNLFLTKQNRKTVDFLSIEIDDTVICRVSGKIGKKGYSRISSNPGSHDKLKETIHKIVNDYIELGYSISEKPKGFRTESQTFDKAKWHFNGSFPKEINITQAYVHTGFFITWLILTNKYENDYLVENEIDIVSLINKKINPSKIYIEIFDGVFMDEGLDDEIVDFINSYFDFDKGSYLKDYEKCFSNEIKDKTLYEVTDNWQNFEKISKVIDKRYTEWKGGETISKLKFWQ